ncbi:hypothetical protein TanjilG_14815 [Lupinus angustifolius]|uniref:X8 domain-containing protein n=2 Tax=Lupinus angustifolius TaxID=3871 RepID=A0A1J7HFT4_LUPAN|nr:hypothetical protein TanjilG_14815 [Lupinus angustifolius]
MNVAAQVVVGGGSVVGESWCLVRTDASFQALQTALDYACSAGADCSVLQPNGLCFLPNTIEAHASYAFNSFYQRKGRAPGSCDFAGTATIAQSDPSYGSCVYPSSASTAGGSTTPIITPPGMNNPNMPSPTMAAPLFGGLSPVVSDNNSRAPTEAIATWLLVLFSFILIIMTLIS